MNFEAKCERGKKKEQRGKIREKRKLNYFFHQVNTLMIRELKYLPNRSMRVSWKVNYFYHQVNILMIREPKYIPKREYHRN